MESISSKNQPFVLHTLDFGVDADVYFEVISKEQEPLKKAILFFKEQLLD